MVNMTVKNGTVSRCGARRPGQEFLRGGEDALLIADERQVIVAGQLEEPRAGQVGRQVPARLDGGEPVAGQCGTRVGACTEPRRRRMSTGPCEVISSTASGGVAAEFMNMLHQ